jgi:hypothetical protein
MRLTPLRLAHLEYDFEPPRARHYDPQCLRGTKCHMPVVAIAAAIGTFAAGAGIAFAATATLGAMVVGGAMMIGAAMVIVGTVTDRPNLVKWGGILSLAGGIGALGLGMVGGLTSGLDAIQAGENVGTAAGGATTDSGVTALSPGDADQALANGTVQSGTATPTGGGILNAGDADQALANQTVQVNAPPQPSATPASAPAASAPAPLTPEASAELAPKAPDAFTANQPNAFNTAPPAAATAPATPGGGYFDSPGAMDQRTKELSKAIFQGGAGLLQATLPPSQYQQALTAESRARAARMDPNSSWWRKGGSG